MALWPNVTFDPFASEERINDTTTASQMGVLTTFMVVGLVFVSARVYTRFVMIKSWGKDDVALIIAAGWSIAGWILFMIQSFNGLGRHIETIPYEQAHIFRLCGFFVTMFVSNQGLCMLKTAIGFNVLRFCCSGSPIWPWYRFVVWGILGVVWIYTACYFSFALTHCDPVHKFWDLRAVGTCIPIPVYTKYAMGNTSLATATDVFLALAPVPIIWRVKLPLRVRLSLIGVLSLGYITVILGIVKTIWQYNFVGQKDKTYNLNVPYWSFLQLTMGLIAASCVALRPLLSKVIRLESYAYGDQSGQAVPTIGSAGRSRSKSHRGFAEIELDETKIDLNGDDSPRMGNSSSASRTRVESSNAGTFYDTQSGSEEAIIGLAKGGGEAPTPGGITRTTKVEVNYVS